MFLLEHDAKELLARRGVPVPAAVLVKLRDGQDAWTWDGDLPPGPWVVKAQVPVGGRGKAGGVRVASTLDEVQRHLVGLLGSTVRGHRVRSCRVEHRISGGVEAYVAFAVDPSVGSIHVLMSRHGGVDIEELNVLKGVVRSAVAPLEPEPLREAAVKLAQELDPGRETALHEAAAALADSFMAYEAVLLEVNPLFLLPDRRWLAGDVKLIIDDNALYRHQDLQELLLRRADAYPGAYMKWSEGFDYVELDPQGEIGLLTTGAGLSMMLVDELARAGLRPYNFCDVRTGQLRGSPHRLVQVLRRIAHGSQVKVVLVNIFAGVTHLGEFARLLVEALEQVPELTAPVVARLVGTGLEEAQRVLGNANQRIWLTTELPEAIGLVATLASRGDAV